MNSLPTVEEELSTVEEELSTVEKDLKNAVVKLGKIRKSECFPLLLRGKSMKGELVDNVYDVLKAKNIDCKKLDVVIDSGGGDINVAYNLALLFRKYGTERLTFIVPRWAKSAATLLTCGGNDILMTPVAELGPLDPQITAKNPLEQRLEQFSPLHIESTLQLIREEFENGSTQLAAGLLQRLQFPLTLGSFKKSLDVGKEYVVKLLTTRMLKDQMNKAKFIGEKLTTGYAHHDWCISVDEARDIGLNVNEIENECLDVVWNIYKLDGKKKVLMQLKEMIRKKVIQKNLKQNKDVPSELIELIELIDLIGSDSTSDLRNVN